jgi:hypothetical protein
VKREDANIRPNGRPLTPYQFLITGHRSQITFNRSPFTVHRSPFTAVHHTPDLPAPRIEMRG